MFITVTVRNVYGNDLVYPADSTAELFAALLGVKTFNARQVSAIKALGYAVHVQGETRLPWEMQVTRF